MLKWTMICERSTSLSGGIEVKVDSKWLEKTLRNPEPRARMRVEAGRTTVTPWSTGREPNLAGLPMPKSIKWVWSVPQVEGALQNYAEEGRDAIAQDGSKTWRKWLKSDCNGEDAEQGTIVEQSCLYLHTGYG